MALILLFPKCSANSYCAITVKAINLYYLKIYLLLNI